MKASEKMLKQYINLMTSSTNSNQPTSQYDTARAQNNLTSPKNLNKSLKSPGNLNTTLLGFDTS